MKVKQQNGVSYFTFEQLESAAVQQGVFGRMGGVSPAPFTSLNLSTAIQDQPEYVQENRRRAYGVFGRSFEQLVHAKLVHKAEVACVTPAEHGQAMAGVDGLITNTPGCGLTMNYADCAPIFVYDPVQKAIGLGHAGWQGTVADVPGAMVRAMQQRFSSRPGDLWAGIGPCIGVQVYEVGENVVEAVKQAFPEQWSQLLLPQPGKERLHFNLAQANVVNLQAVGVKQIELAGFCTGQRTDLFFSHRCEGGKTGRFGAVFILN